MPWAAAEPTGLDEKIELLRRMRGSFDLGTEFVYGIFDEREERVLGGSGLHARIGPTGLEIGYWIHAGHVRQGLASETVAALTRVGFELHGVERIEIHCDPANTASAGVPRKLGFNLDATLRRRAATPDGRPRDTMIWSLFADEFPHSAAASESLRAFDAAGRPIV